MGLKWSKLTPALSETKVGNPHLTSHSPLSGSALSEGQLYLSHHRSWHRIAGNIPDVDRTSAMATDTQFYIIYKSLPMTHTTNHKSDTFQSSCQPRPITHYSHTHLPSRLPSHHRYRHPWVWVEMVFGWRWDFLKSAGGRCSRNVLDRAKWVVSNERGVSQ